MAKIVRTEYEYSSWGPWRQVYSYSDGRIKYQRSRKGRQIHHYEGGRVERQSGWSGTYTQTKMEFPSGYGKTPQEKARAGTSSRSSIPPGTNIETGQPAKETEGGIGVNVPPPSVEKAKEPTKSQFDLSHLKEGTPSAYEGAYQERPGGPIKYYTPEQRGEPGRYTPQQWKQMQQKQYEQIQQERVAIEQERASILPYGTYDVTTPTGTRRMPGFILTKIYSEGISKYEKAEQQSQKAWQSSVALQTEAHPETYIQRTGEGYQVKVPYAGAEKYQTYKRALERGGLGGLFATAWTPEDPLGIASAWEQAAGRKQKALDIKIQSLARVESIKSPLDAASWYVESPATQIGIAVVGGAALKPATAFAKGAISARYGVTGMRAFQVGGLALGGTLIGTQAYDIAKTYESGEQGRAVARAGMLGLQVVGAYGGYKSISDKTARKAFEVGWKTSLRGTPSVVRDKPLYIFKKGIPVKTERIYLEGPRTYLESGKTLSRRIPIKTTIGSKATLKFFQSRGTPYQRTRLEILRATKYRPGKTIVIDTKPPSRLSIEVMRGRLDNTLARFINIKGYGKPRGFLGRRIIGFKGTQIDITKKVPYVELPPGSGGITIQVPKTQIPTTSLMGEMGNVFFKVPYGQYIPLTITTPISRQITTPISRDISPAFKIDTDIKVTPIKVHSITTKPIYDYVPTTGQVTTTTQDVTPIQFKATDFSQTSIQQTQSLMTPSVITKGSSYVTKGIRFPYFPYAPMLGGGGGGRQVGRSKQYLRGYRLRKWKVPSMEQFLGGI